MHGSIEAMVVAESSDEEDKDFVPEKDDAGSPTDDDSEEGGSDAPKDGDGEESKNKEPAASMPVVKKKKRDEGEDDGEKKKRKKDPNAPKRSLSSFMFFSQVERTRLRKTNPGMSFKDVAKVLGEAWKKMTAEEKEPYEASAERDKTRYAAEMAIYKGGKDASAPTVS